MATVTAGPPALSGDLAVFHTTDPLLANAPVLIFHGAAATIGATSSRIQVHIFTPAGQASYPRLAVSPNSPFYSAVSNLPREEQGDETCRGIAFGLKKYFDELPSNVKKTWGAHAKSASPQALFKDNHVAILASRMTPIENVNETIGSISRSFAAQRLPWIDVDVVLPPNTIKELSNTADPTNADDVDEAQSLKTRYGPYADIVAGFGETAFLPTSKLKRAPSKATSIGRSASFLKQQKENARNEISELLETEGSYLSRLHELKDIADTIGQDLKEASRTRLSEVFPSSIDAITRANQCLLDAMQAIVSSTEESAHRGIQSTADSQLTAQQVKQDLLSDGQGITAIANCLCEHLPDFKDCYTSYLTCHAEAAMLLRNLMRSSDSALQGAIQDVGEQRLTSLLIEPVQRLPRYTLYIDGICKQLPVRHPALRPLLKARDLVSEICSQDDANSGNGGIEARLRNRIVGLPDEVSVQSRLVTAVDYTELSPPYDLEKSIIQHGILLLFADSMILLERHGDNATSARMLLTELEATLPQKQKHTDVVFARYVPLTSIECTECHEGQSVQLITFDRTDLTTVGGRGCANSLQVLLLEGSYEGKAHRLVEDITKARVEGRFSEAEREGPKWEARATNAQPDQMQLFSAIFEDFVAEHVSSRKDMASIRVIVDIDKHSQKHRAGQKGIRTVVTISPMRDGLYRLSIDSIDGPGGCEHVPVADLAAIIRRKLASLVFARFAIHQTELMELLLDHNTDILQSFELQAAGETETTAVKNPQSPPKRQRSNNLRPLSPVKMLSSLLSSSGPGSQPPMFLRREPSTSSIPSLGSIPSVPPTKSTPHITKPPSRDSRPTSNDRPRPRSEIAAQPTVIPDASLQKIEDILSAYLLALKARKGNIVGRSLKMRAMADELAVNELYNTLLENHQMMVHAAQAPVDVLFAAFEKFLAVAWKDQVGQIMPTPLLHDIQSKAETSFPTDFDKYLRSTIQTLPPPNQRAFKGIINLLHDLLDGTGNDADRGALTAAFAEVLVPDGNPHDYIALIDRFVDDAETYFGEPLPEAQVHDDESMISQNTHKRSRSANTGSLTSNTSSLRRKFGLGGLSRENSKSEQDSKVASVWRTLSKSRSGEASPANSISRGSLHRTRSTDIDVRAQSRPVSQDGSLARSVDELAPLPVAAEKSPHHLGLSTIGEHPSFIPTGPPKKKRRSSLSDLKGLDTPFMTPQRPNRPVVTRKASIDKSLPASPMPSTPSSKGGSFRIPSPSRGTPRAPLPASFRRENSPGPAKALDLSPGRPKSQHSTSTEDVVTITASSPGPKARPTSNIPTLAPRAVSPSKIQPPVTPIRNGLSERSDAGNIVKKASPRTEKAVSMSPAKIAASPTKKLRIQSPQKLRERLQNEQAAVAAAHTSLQDELGKIGDELSATPNRLVPKGSLQRSSAAAGTGVDLAAKVLKMEAMLPNQIASLTAKLEGIRSDLSSSLAVSESKCRKLDELYREANAENEALYSRFNDELARVMKTVRGGGGVGELERRLKEQEEEVSRLRKENGRLKREAIGLRAQLKE